MLDYLFPVCCPICQKPVVPKGSFLHEECKRKIKLIETPFCLKCGRKIKDESAELCSSCRSEAFAFDAGRCTFAYHSGIGEAIKWVKEEGTCEFVDFFGRTAAERHSSFIEAARPEVIVPVPMDRRKEMIRGFNQSELIAESLSKHINVPVKGLLCKVGKTRDQKRLNRQQRTQNLARVFDVVKEHEKMPERVLIADDIFTTGSTVNACAMALKRAGVKKVYFICIAAGTADD
ncbi:MAG: double zinc ribbon domain-containing protein [Lachnospiraceae bacterium]|nr:double zinc ribbon domain-containing protein [Lachnospiraceae bacterium]